MMELACYVAGQKVANRKELEIHSPYDRRLVGRVLLAGRQQTEAAIEAGLASGEPLTRFARAGILDREMLEQTHEDAKAEAEAALEEALKEPKPTAEDIHRFTYAPSPVDPVYPEDYTGLPS